MLSSYFKICGCDLTASGQGSHGVLLEAAHDGDLDTVCHELDLGVNVNCTNEHGSTPLLLASLRGHFRVVDILIKRGGSVQKPGPAHWTPLHAACYYGHVGVVCLLLANKANPKARNADGMLPGKEFDTAVPIPVRKAIQKLLDEQTAQGGPGKGPTAADGLNMSQLEELLAAIAIESDDKSLLLAEHTQAEEQTRSKMNSTASSFRHTILGTLGMQAKNAGKKDSAPSGNDAKTDEISDLTDEQAQHTPRQTHAEKKSVSFAPTNAHSKGDGATETTQGKDQSKTEKRGGGCCIVS